MKTTASIFIYLFFVLQTAASTYYPESMTLFQDTLPGSQPKSETIGLQRVGKFLALKCLINNRPACFIIDTGATYSVVHSRTSKHYNFKILDRKGIQTTEFGNGSTPIKIATGIEITIGNDRLSMTLLAINLSKIVRLIYRDSGLMIMGILGTDILTMLGCTLDFGDGTMEI